MTKVRDDFCSDYEWLEYCSEFGVSDLQISLASKILASRTDAMRLIDAYKWLFIAQFLDNTQANDLAAFIRRSMTETQVSIAENLVVCWLNKKWDELLRAETIDWSTELLVQITRNEKQ